MGRRAKYFTLVEKTQACKERRAILKLRPEAIAAKQAENRRQYLRRKPIPTLPDSLRLQAKAAMSWSSWGLLFDRFYRGEDSLAIDELYLEENDFRALLGRPPYPNSLTTMDIDSFQDIWPQLSAAIHGYMSCRYAKDVEGRTSRIRDMTDSAVIEELWHRYTALSKDHVFLMGILKGKSMLQYTPEELLAMINLNWISRLIVFAVEDLEAFRYDRSHFIRTCIDRLWTMGTCSTT
ncbi:hypothetical protein DFP72DRAFT_847837 [Ephemerocybe angulata]|uniref:Uncharacterized protein n=1 Tax=Ephemerocybe angulata TaxID=980116 RepID=A0A8H6HXL6_9AGAR|nr:hypothetical protein DFP72DRAFT_847837 [Tulosesus angulatus]